MCTRPMNVTQITLDKQEWQPDKQSIAIRATATTFNDDSCTDIEIDAKMLLYDKESATPEPGFSQFGVVRSLRLLWGHIMRLRL
jgi:hypothetical protein